MQSLSLKRPKRASRRGAYLAFCDVQAQNLRMSSADRVSD
jgi:hypothetical protein